MKRSLLLCISFIVFLTAPLLHAAETEEHSDHGSTLQEILILNSYHPGFSWSDDEQAGIIDVFRAKDKTWVPVIEYLDLKRLPDGKHIEELKKLFHLKYQNKKFSVVIAMDNPALEFAIVNQSELFRNAPIVFCGINNYSPSLLKGRSDVSGIVETIDIAGTIEVMLRLHPATQEIFSPHDYTATGLAVRKELEALVPRFDKVRFRFTDPLTMGELLKELERLPKNSLVLEIGFITDKSGRTFGISETTKLFYEHSPVPIYSTFEQRLGFGIVGGKLLNARIHGTNAGRIALRLLAGEKASAIPVVLESDSQFMFDYKVMSRFGIPLSALPEGSTVINKPVSFYAAHRVQIQATLGIIGFLVVVISLLAINIIQRRRSSELIRQSEGLFKIITSNNPDHLIVQDSDLRYSFVMNPPLGMTEQDMIGKTDYDFLSEEDADKLTEIKRQVLKTGLPVNVEVPLTSSEGEQQFFNGSYIPKFDATGRVDGFVGYFRNVTERKRAEETLRRSEENFRRSLDSSPLGVRIVTEEGETIYANQAILDIYGYDCIEELQTTPVKKRYTPESYAEFQIRMEKRKRGDYTPSEYDLCIVKKDGEVHHLQVFRKAVLWNGEKQFQVIYQDITEGKLAEQELRVSREQMRALASRLQAVREEERTRIAREIHDELGGALTGLKIDFSLLTRAALKIENETVRTSLLVDMDAMIKFIDATIRTVRRIAMELRPGVLDDLGLVAALEWQLIDFEKRTGIRCEFFPPMEEISLDDDLSTALFRIFQEALTNVARHSGATEISVHLRADADSSTLEVEDNGKGIEQEQALSSKSLGLLGMRERAQMFGGRITVTGTPGIGTKVTVEIPPAAKGKMDRDQEGDAG
jgi:PAS domain S-box-containing protein